MGRKLTSLTLVGLLLAIGSCSSSAEVLEEDKPKVEYEAVVVPSTHVEAALSKTHLAKDCIEQIQYINKDAPFICPAIIEGNTFHRGQRYSWDTVIYSGSSANTTFSLTATESSNLRSGYTSFNKDSLKWITIQDQATGKRKVTGLEADFKPYEAKVFKITLEIPKKTTAPQKLEFRLRTKNITQGGSVQVALEQRCLIDIKD